MLTLGQAPWPNCFRCTGSVGLVAALWSKYCCPLLFMGVAAKTQRGRLAHCHITTKPQSWDLNPGNLVLEALLLASRPHWMDGRKDGGWAQRWGTQERLRGEGEDRHLVWDMGSHSLWCPHTPVSSFLLSPASCLGFWVLRPHTQLPCYFNTWKKSLSPAG